MGKKGFVPSFSMILRILFFAFLAYLAYKLIFGLILPVYRTTRRMRKTFREMQDRMQEQTQQYSNQQYQSHQNASHQHSKYNKGVEEGDYIDFEEIK